MSKQSRQIVVTKVQTEDLPTPPLEEVVQAVERGQRRLDSAERNRRLRAVATIRRPVAAFPSRDSK